jgi:hypothetical protein
MPNNPQPSGYFWTKLLLTVVFLLTTNLLVLACR